MIQKPHHEPHEATEAIQFYRNSGAEVRKLYCGASRKKGCGKLLALEVRGIDGIRLGEHGWAVIPLGDDLLSHRVRLDEHTSGRMVGYQCKCGNDTRLSAAEKHHPPVNGWYTNLLPHEPVTLALAIRACVKAHQPDYEEQSGRRRYESFVTEQVS